MSEKLSDEKLNEYMEFNNTLKLLKLDIIKVNFEKNQSKLLSSPEQNKIEINWGFALADNDPIIVEDENEFIIRPKIDLNCLLEKKAFYTHSSAFSLTFGCATKERLEKIHNDIDEWKFFIDKIVIKTLWPFYRQQVHEGMSTVGLTPITLPFIF